MNLTLYITYILTSLLLGDVAETTIDFNFGTLELTGGAPEITIKGHDEQYIKVITDSGAELESGIDYKIKKNRMSLIINDAHESVTILIPRQVDVECFLNGIVFEGRLDRDFRTVSFVNVTGDIEFNADGYDIELKDPGANVSIVTYGVIEGWFSDFEEDVLISLDTYWGNVKAHIPFETTTDVNLTSISGKAIIDQQFNVTRRLAKHENNFIGEINGGGMKIILHSEAGKYVHLTKL